MKQLTAVLIIVAAVGAGGCGKSKDKDGGGGGGGAGASCADAAANFVMGQAADKYGKLGKLSPTPEQLKALTAMVQAQCETGKFEEMTYKPWTAATRTCVAKAKPQAKMTDPNEASECFQKQERGYSLGVLQIVHVFVEAEKAKAAAAPPPPPPPPAPSPSAGSGSVPGAAPTP